MLGEGIDSHKRLADTKVDEGEAGWVSDEQVSA